MIRSFISVWLLLLAGQITVLGAVGFRAGAAAIDITPMELPVIVNGGFLEKQAYAVQDEYIAMRPSEQVHVWGHR